MTGWPSFPAPAAATPSAGTRVADQQHWGHGWVAAQNEWRPVRFEAGQRCNGFGMEYRNLFAAAYASNGVVWLQAGSRAWDTSAINRVVQRYDYARTSCYELHLANGESALVKLHMPNPVAMRRLVDPIYDEIASWSDDIMKLFPYLASDGWTASDEDVQSWARRVLSLWTSGVKHGP